MNRRPIRDTEDEPVIQIFGSLARMETSYFISNCCRSLAPEDQQLVRWFEELDGVQDVSTSRSENIDHH